MVDWHTDISIQWYIGILGELLVLEARFVYLQRGNNGRDTLSNDIDLMVWWLSSSR